MTVNVEIKPEVEARLAVRANSVGESLEGYIQRMLENDVISLEQDTSSVESGVEKAAAFRSWAKSVPPSLPTLSLDDVSRERMYESN